MLRSPVLRILLGYAVPATIVLGIWAVRDTPWDPGPHGGGAVVILLSFTAVPLATALLVGGSVAGLRALRVLGWRSHPAAAAVVAGGALGGAFGVAFLAFLVSLCARG